jgi:hypothetical protein
VWNGCICLVVGSSKLGNELLGSVKCDVFLDYPRTVLHAVIISTCPLNYTAYIQDDYK